GGTMNISGRVHAIVNTSSTLTFNGTISGSGKLSRDFRVPAGGYAQSIGGGFDLAAGNIHTGGAEVLGGVLRLSHNLALSTNGTVLISGTNSGSFTAVNTPRLDLNGNVTIPPGVTATFVPSGDLGSRADLYSFNNTNEWQGTILVRSNGAFELGG